MAELTDETNAARGFSFLLMTWALGIVIGLGIYSCLLSLVPADIPHLLAHLWVASYHSPKTAGRTSSRTLSGPNILTFFHVW